MLILLRRTNPATTTMEERPSGVDRHHRRCRRHRNIRRRRALVDRNVDEAQPFAAVGGRHRPAVRQSVRGAGRRRVVDVDVVVRVPPSRCGVAHRRRRRRRRRRRCCRRHPSPLPPERAVVSWTAARTTAQVVSDPGPRTTTIFPPSRTRISMRRLARRCGLPPCRRSCSSSGRREGDSFDCASWPNHLPPPSSISSPLAR